MDIENNNLLLFARRLPDHRMERKKLHLAEDIVYMTLAAVICGADTWEDIAEFGRSKKDFLEEVLSLKNGIPSPDTFNRFFAGLAPGEFEKEFMSWVKGICKENKGVVSFDGKTVRGSRKKGNKSAIHMVSAFAQSNNLVLGQIKTAEKSNEITAIPELINLLDIEGCTVTIDAMGCQTKIAHSIIEHKADYALAVKENQKELYANIQDTFRFVAQEKQASFEDVDAGHGRVETRKCTVTSDLSHISRADDWEKIQTLVRIESERYIKATAVTQRETRYYISSLAPDPNYLEKVIRSHWGIENKLHWHLDVSFNEDKSRKRDRNAAENYSVILRLALNLVKNERSTKRSVRTKRLKAGWDNEYLKLLLNF
jgi:predicted transposase YbfD/YdcC